MSSEGRLLRHPRPAVPRALWPRARYGLRRLTDPIPVTPLGLFVAVGAWLALDRLAFAQMDMVFLVVGYAALGLVGVAVLAVLVSALVLKLRRRPAQRDEPVRLDTWQQTPTGYRLPSLGWLPLVQLRWSWERPAGVRVEPERRWGRLDEVITVSDRGEMEGVRRRLVVQDAFGLARVALREDDPIVLEARPHPGGLRRMPVLTSLAGGDELPHPMGVDDGDRVELRRYVPGDPARFIHWKVFGRTRKLMVRVPERALTKARRTVAYLVAGPDDDASAAAARVAIEQDAFGGEWVFSADGATDPATTVADALRLVVRSSAARDRAAEALPAFVERTERSGPASLVVFAPPRPGPWLERVAQLGRGRPQGMRVVIAVDALRAPESVPWWRRLLAAETPRPGVPTDALDEVLRVLSAARCEVSLFERPSGRQIGRGGKRARVPAVAAATRGRAA